MWIRRFDVLLLLVLVSARLRIDTLADLVAPRPIETIQKVPWLASLLSAQAWKLLENWLTDPLSLLLIALTMGLVLAYVVVDLVAEKSRFSFPLKLALVFAIIATTVIAQASYLIALRHVTGPAAYTHDGGVILTEETMRFLSSGKNPYTEDYTHTPLADWGLDYRTTLYHYPYLPWTFLFSMPFYWASITAIGWFDQRFVYLLLFILALLMASRLATEPVPKLSLVMILGLNPIMGSDIIFGQNDVFVLFWIVLALWLLPSRRSAEGAGARVATARSPGLPSTHAGFALSLVAFALACASKPTAWFVAPFYFAYVLGETNPQLRIRQSVGRLMPFLIVFLAVNLPFVIWDPYNFYDDVWAWSAGTSPTAYQIRGWGLSNFVLAFNLVPSRLAYFPFWIPELLISVPLLVVMLRRQWRENSLANIAWHGAVLLFAYAFASRFLNENYVAFIVALLALGVFASEPFQGSRAHVA